jgi:glycosyltransferase involved in cell wall biosynthesis
MTPRLCVVGPLIGRNPGSVTTQGERLIDLFQQAGYPVIGVSDFANKYMRLADILGTLMKRRNDYDIAVLQVFSGQSFVVEDLASAVVRQTGPGLIMVLRGGGMPVFMSDRPRWSRRVLSRADQLVSPSKFLARSVVPLGFNSTVIPNVIQLTAYRHRLRRQLAPRLLWMRSFHEIYNPLLAISVFGLIKQRFPNATLVMAGSDRGLETKCRQVVKKLGLDQSVRFAGFLNEAKKAQEFDAADVYLNTNRIDNTPVSVIEACASGVPVVATRVGGVSDLLTNDDNGLLVGSEDERGMADAVCSLLADPDRAARLSAGGRRLAESCSVEQVMPLWEGLIDNVLKSRRARTN